jgi:type IV secretion system protein VirB5
MVPAAHASFRGREKSNLEIYMTTKTVKRIAVGLLLAASSSAFAGIPVTVIASVPDTLNQVQTMTQWANQYKQMVDQLKGMERQYKALSGSRNLGQILNNPALRNYLPDEWAGVYSQVASGSLVGLSNSAKALATAEGFSTTATGARKRQQDVLVTNKAMTMAAYDASLKRVQNINALMVQADAQEDAKGAADLANRMAAENAMIQNEQIRLNLLVQLQAAEAQLAAEQRSREFDTAFAK